MKRNLVALGLAATMGWNVPAAAQDFQLEGGLGLTRLDPELGASDSLLGADVTWHFAAVKTANLPLAEAGFLTRSSNLFGAYITADKADRDTLVLGGEFYVENFYVAAAYNRIDNGATSNDFAVRLGFLPTNGMLLTFGYAKQDLADVDAISLEMKYVIDLVADSALNLEAGLTLVDDAVDTKVLDLAADYYFGHMLSGGVTVGYSDNDLDDNTVIGVRGRYFFTPTFSVQGSYETDGDNDEFGVRLALRF